MNELVRKGNVYRSIHSDSRMYYVIKVGARSANVVNMRTGLEYIVRFDALLTNNELVGTPYTPKKETIQHETSKCKHSAISS